MSKKKTKADSFSGEVVILTDHLLGAVDDLLENKQHITQPTLSFLEGQKAILETYKAKVKSFYPERYDFEA